MGLIAQEELWSASASRLPYSALLDCLTFSVPISVFQFFSFQFFSFLVLVRDKFASVGVDPDDVEGLSEVFSNLPQPFEGLETCYKQEKYYREKMGLVVSIYMYNTISLIECKGDG